MARLYQRGRVWWCWGYDGHGRRWYASTKQRDKAAARRVAREIERRKAVDGATYAALGLEALIMYHVEHRERLGRGERTIANYRQFGGHICRILGADMSVHDLTIDHMERYWDERRAEGAKETTVARELQSLRAALRLASARDMWGGSLDAVWPSELVRDVYTPRDRWLTQHEYLALRAQLPETRRDYLDAYVYTGARRRTLFRVRAEDVDLERGQVRLRGTKTKRSDRRVPIHEAIRPVLAMRMSNGVLFPPWDGDETLAKAARRAKIPHVCFNDLRRTFCSWLCQAGVPSLVAARLMGHGSTAMVERVYAQLAPRDLREAVDSMPTVTGGVTEPAPESALNGRSGHEDNDE